MIVVVIARTVMSRLFDFFQMPQGYTGNDIGSVRSHERLPGEIYRERPFFVCYVEGLSFPSA